MISEPARYILQNNRPVLCADPKLWEAWMSVADGRCFVARTRFRALGVVVSTVFTGEDYAPTKSLGPLVFETLVRGGDMDGYVQLYRTRKSAQAGHEDVCWNIRQTMN